MSMPTAPHAPFSPQPAPKAPSRKVPVATGIAGLLVGIIFGAAGSSTDPKTAAAASQTPQAVVTVTAPAAPAATATTVVTVTAQPPAPAQPAGPATTIGGNGRYEVGVDMAPGKYKTAGPADDVIKNCYWERNNGGDGLGSIIANDNTQGPATVTVKQGEFFKVSGCQEWTKVG